MGERKVLNKYYPPDFDPEKLPRGRRPKDRLEAVRFMLPMTVRCKTCGEYMYAGKKFNAKKETVKNEEYLGIKIYRFYVKCAGCSSPFTIKTDPKNADYVCEHGVSRNYEIWKQEEEAEKEAESLRREQEEDAMQALENKTMDMKEEMELLDTLDELKSLKAREAKLDPDYLLLRQKRIAEENSMKSNSSNDEENLVAEVFHPKKRQLIVIRPEESENNSALVSDSCKRIDDAPKRERSAPRGSLLNGKLRLNAVKKETSVNSSQTANDKLTRTNDEKDEGKKSSVLKSVVAYESDTDSVDNEIT
ncbi:hypothetical protein GAYE_SCF13G3408 [Galdieria yellowstonensis]|uniref:Splicing factor YJU2 n=1 Tax=Galdieria yellowstonensis TaxID=3028027 RepID=A0AAV9IDP4_9RHOD|nr:hypothetical protein GAYE_SCF13G3408 [Galdieria yellowstonensis]